MKPISMKTIGRLLLTLPGLLLLVSHPVQATDGKVYHGTMCEVNGNNVDHPLSFLNGGVYNDAEVTTYAVCPVVRDNVEWHWEKVYIRVLDNHPSADFTCYFRYASSSVRSVRSSGTGTQSLTITNPASGSPIGPLPGPYNLLCAIPGKYGSQRSVIQSYQVNEE